MIVAGPVTVRICVAVFQVARLAVLSHAGPATVTVVLLVVLKPTASVIVTTKV